MPYRVNFGGASFVAYTYQVSAETQVAAGERAARDTTSITIDLLVNSNNVDLPHSEREKLFHYSFRPQNQEPELLTVEVREPGTEDSAKPLCTYTFQRAWVTLYREYRAPGQPDIQVQVRFRALFNVSPTPEVEVKQP
jgi:hypothetical protein